MKKFIALLLAFSIFSLYGNLNAKERRGADLVVQKTDAQQVKGELITVKKESLLLKDTDFGTDVSVDVSDIKTIKIVRKSKGGLGALTGFGIGGVLGIVLVAALENEPISGDPCFLHYLLAASIFGAPAALLGWIIGEIAGKDITIQIEGKSDSEIKETLEKLRKKARVPDFQ